MMPVNAVRTKTKSKDCVNGPDYSAFDCKHITKDSSWSFETAIGYHTFKCDDKYFVGRYAVGDSIILNLNDIPAHSKVYLSWTVARVDSWTCDQDFIVYADGQEVFSEHLNSQLENLCGNANWYDAIYTLTTEFDHTSDTLALEFTSSLNETSDTESWGICGVEISYVVPGGPTPTPTEPTTTEETGETGEPTEPTTTEETGETGEPTEPTTTEETGETGEPTEPTTTEETGETGEPTEPTTTDTTTPTEEPTPSTCDFDDDDEEATSCEVQPETTTTEETGETTGTEEPTPTTEEPTETELTYTTTTVTITESVCSTNLPSTTTSATATAESTPEPAAAAAATAKPKSRFLRRMKNVIIQQPLI